jgi:phosphatidylserine synthase
MRKSLGRLVYNNLANGVSILGVLPLCILFLKDGSQYLVPLMVYNNIMDDLDGILAAKLNIKSEFGAILDNVCDGFSHTLFVMLVATQYPDFPAIANIVPIAIGLSGLMAATSLLLRVVDRLSPKSATGTGSPTNELIRHLLFVLLLSNNYEFNPALILIAIFALHAMSMLVPIRMPYLIRSLTKSATAISLVNVALVVAWLVPPTTLVIAACFVISYLYSIGWGCLKWLKRVEPKASE